MSISLFCVAFLASAILALVSGAPFILTSEKEAELRGLNDCEHDWGPTDSDIYMRRVVRTQVKISSTTKKLNYLF